VFPDGYRRVAVCTEQPAGARSPPLPLPAVGVRAQPAVPGHAARSGAGSVAAQPVRRRHATEAGHLADPRGDQSRHGAPPRQGLNQLSCCSVPAGSGIRCLFDPWLRDPGSGMGKKSGSGSEVNNPDHISESLETIFLAKILKFFDAESVLKTRKFELSFILITRYIICCFLNRSIMFLFP
jgi:hypothetical protein